MRKYTANVELMSGFRLFVCFTLHNKTNRFLSSYSLLFLWSIGWTKAVFMICESLKSTQKKQNKCMLIISLCRLFVNQSTVVSSSLTLLHYYCHSYTLTHTHTHRHTHTDTHTQTHTHICYSAPSIKLFHHLTLFI